MFIREMYGLINLLNYIVCDIDHEDKVTIGYLGTIEIIMYLTQTRLETEIAYDLLEPPWTVLWNITYETAENCRKFIEDNNGLQAFTGKVILTKIIQNE
ncbi:unnamed protein product [Didymodactylos carnosus]|uniref:Protein zer-1 homolog-like C-terminal domain-containing protein n=1 Tax=Didymodactylos carnosus TaxID=1234261 RepID=A0A815GHG4_9BILA|nr:unnamed protein product [Didymodactylos carnosus]CAF1338624.1 unnamed protein product [Didymodactylos carnosus]CAF3568227.1 unnamed protein product [Didymodactylos carnosus]CAF4197667.1 unnamed protein product [Didymodactylos carnosus]